MLNELIKYDTNFNEASFKSYIANVFVKILTSIMLDELSNIKHFVSEEVYKVLEQKVANLNRQNIRQMYDELNVRDSNIINVDITEQEFIITVSLIARYLDYQLDKNTGDFLRGNDNTRIEKEYILTFTKKRNFLQQNAVRKCPGCGASISVNTTGVCEYCGTVYDLERYDYILTDMTNL